MKLESLVIVDQHATVNMFTGLVHTARQVPEISCTLNENVFYNSSKLYVAPRPRVKRSFGDFFVRRSKYIFVKE